MKPKVLEESGKLSQMTTSELHRLLREYRWVYTIFSQIGGRAKIRAKAMQSLLMKRGVKDDGSPQKPENMRHPVTGGGFTDHAILRFMERAKGLDVAAVEAEMRTRVENGESFFNGAVVKDAADMTYVFRQDGLCVSVMPNEWFSEADGVVAEHALRRGKTERKDRALAAKGFDTTARPPKAKPAA